MDSEAMAAAGEASAACWTPSTNWIVARRSLHDAVSFESSADDAPSPISGGLLLLRPLSDDPPPCEVTVCFREKHEIHRVYVRSTARVYEIYYASDQQNNSEYLCTVRCGATLKEVKLPSDTDAATSHCQISNNGDMALSEQMSKGNIASSDEDGWVEVEVPDSLLDDPANSVSKAADREVSTNLQMLYEATAEISDASSCVSITLRLLSLQDKSCVRIEEIYIYADPVESTSSDPPVTMGVGLGGNPLLTMLVPSLLQLSKSGIRRNLSHNPGVQKHPHDTDGATGANKLDMEKPQPQETCCSIADQVAEPACETNKVRPEDTQMTHSHCESVQDQIPKSNLEENHQAYTRVEKVLDELVLRVGRIEAFCLRFEENLMKPISCIERKLQKLEQQLDAFAVNFQSSESFPSLKISAPEFSSEESDSENEGCNGSHTAREDATFVNLSSSHTDMTTSVLAPQICPSLIVKAPEFSSEDESTDADDTLDSLVEGCPKEKSPSLVDSALANTDDTLDSVPKDYSMDKTPSSVDSALASALAALLSSTTVRSPPSPTLHTSLLDESNKMSHADDSVISSSSVDVTSESSGKTHSGMDVENSDCSVSDGIKRVTDFDDSSVIADAVKAPHLQYEMFTGVVVTAPEFPNEHGDYINCDDNISEPEAKSDFSTSGLAAYLSSSMVKSAGDSQICLNVASKDSNFDDNELASSPAQVLCEEADKSGIEKHVNNVDCNITLDSTLNEEADESGIEKHTNNVDHDINLDSAFNYLLPEYTMQKEHGAIEYRHDSMEVPAEGTSCTCMPPQNRLVPKETKWHEQDITIEPTEVGVFKDNILDCKLNSSVNQKWGDGGCTDDSDAEEAAYRGATLNQLGRGWIEDSSSISSIEETFMGNKVQIDWSDGSSTESMRGDGTVNLFIELADNVCTSSQIAAERNVSHSLIGEPSRGSDHGKSKSEQKWSLDCLMNFHDLVMSRAAFELEVNAALDCGHSIPDVKFSQESNWKGAASLEVLLGDNSGAKEQASVVDADDASVSSIVNGCEHGSSSFQNMEQGGSRVGLFLWELGTAKASNFEDDDGPHGPGSPDGSSSPLFTSLI